MAKKVPKYIREKCDQMESYLDRANFLKHDIEAWMQKNGINVDELHEDNEDYLSVYDECSGCFASISADGIEEMLNKKGE